MSTLDAHGKPLVVGVVEDEIVLTGEGRVGIALTPEAAAETAERLQAAAQRVQKRDSARTGYASQACANEP